MIDSEFEKRGRAIPEVDTEYTWTAEPLPVPVCLQVASCNGAVILALEKRIAELERERDAAKQSRARLVGLVLFKNLEIDVLVSDVKDLDTGNKELLAELEAAQAKLAEYEGGRWHSFETVQAIVKERDAATQRAEKAERERDEFQDRLTSEWAVAIERDFERQQVLDVSATAEYYRALVQDARDERDAAQQSRARLIKLFCAIDETLPTDGKPHYHGLMGRLNLLTSRLEYAEQGLLDYAILRVCLTERISKAETECNQLRAELDAANERIKKQLHEIALLSKERERLALVIDSNKFHNTAAELIYQLRLEIVAEKERAEQAEADARRLAHIAKNVHIVSESENNLIEKYAK